MTVAGIEPANSYQILDKLYYQRKEVSNNGHMQDPDKYFTIKLTALYYIYNIQSYIILIKLIRVSITHPNLLSSSYKINNSYNIVYNCFSISNCCSWS